MARYEIKSGRPGRVSETAPAYGEADPQPTPQAYAVTMADRGRLVLPAKVRERLKIKEGDRLTLRVDPDGTIRLQTPEVFAQSLVGLCKHLAPGRVVSDELIAERRLEAAMDDRKDREFIARHRLKRRR